MGEFIAGQAARERFRVLLDRVDDACAEMRGLSCDEVGTSFRIEMAERLETQLRVNRGLMYRVFGQLADPPDEGLAVRLWKDRVGARLRIPVGEVTRRVKVAARILPRRQLSGPALEPELPEVAAAVAEGTVGEDHLKVITATMDRLASVVSVAERADVEASLVREASKHDADFVRVLGRGIGEIFNPDGVFDEADRARRRGLTLGKQQPDGMSKVWGWLDPEARAYLEAATAAARPGRHLPDTPDTDSPDPDTPGPDSRDSRDSPGGQGTAVRDDRSPAQRCHDGLKLALKAGIASGQLGAHRGHAVTVIVRTSLGELNQAFHAVSDPNISMPGPARTGGNTVVPMRDLIRMATDAIHYLAVFEDHSDRPLYLGRQKRIATADQRIICYSRDGGCTRPDCLQPGYHCEVHHDLPWAHGGATDADSLFFGCGPDHGALTEGHYSTTVTERGRLAWTDGTAPARVNTAHHPEELLRGNPDPPRR